MTDATDATDFLEGIRMGSSKLGPCLKACVFSYDTREKSGMICTESLLTNNLV